MRIAVLFFGQPRFLDLTAPFIAKYFNQICNQHTRRLYNILTTTNKSFVDYRLDYFAHFWKNINYSPKTPEEDINVDKVSSILKEHFNILDENYCIEDYSVLEKFGNDLNTFHNFLGGIFNNKKHRRDVHFDGLKGLYGTGQYYSFGEVYNLMEAYESRNSFKYDVVIRVRTDYIINGIDIHDLINFKTLHVPTIKVACGNVVEKILHKKNVNLTKFNESFYKTSHIARGENPWYDDWNLGLPRLRDHLWCYNRPGADIFIQKYWLYYFLVFIHDYLNIPLHIVKWPEIFSYMSNQRYHSCEVLQLLIAGMTGAEIERLNYDIFRVAHPTSKEKYRNSGLVLTEYTGFNNNNDHLLDQVDNFLKEYLNGLPEKNKNKQKDIKRYTKLENKRLYDAFNYEI